jgi:lysophospholipase L1-like esterase
LAAALAAVAFLGACAQAGVRFSRSVALAKASEPYQQQPAQPAVRVLIVGVSTAVGTGAADPRASIAGRIAQDHPAAAIVNLGEDGARLADVHDQIRRAGGGFDLVLVQAGGNDVIRFASAAQLEEGWLKVAHAAAAGGRRSIIMPAGNVGTAPFFFAPVSWAMTERARSAREIAARAAQGSGARFVDLFFEREEDPFLRDPKRFYAADFLHPSAAGYALWYEALERQGGLRAALRAGALTAAKDELRPLRERNGHAGKAND